MDRLERIADLLTNLRPQIEGHGNRRIRGYGEELYSDVCEACLARAERYDWEHPRAAGLVWRIAQRKAATHCRQSGVARNRTVRIDDCAEPTCSIATTSESEPKRNEADVLVAVRRLPSNQRELLLDHFWRGMRAVDIARRDGVPPGRVRLRLHRAKQAIAKRLCGIHREGDR